MEEKDREAPLIHATEVKPAKQTDQAGTSSEHGDKKTEKSKRESRNIVKGLVLSAFLHVVAVIGISPENRKEIIDTANAGINAAKKELVKVSKELPGIIDEWSREVQLLFESEEVVAYKRELLAKIEAGEEVPLGPFFIKSEKVSGAVSEDKTLSAEKKDKQILEHFMEMAKNEPNKLKVLHEIIQSEGQYLEESTFFTKLRNDGVGNCVARSKHVIWLVQNVYPEMPIRRQIYTSHEIPLVKVGDVWYIMEKPTLRPVTKEDLQGTVLMYPESFVLSYLEVVPKQEYIPDNGLSENDEHVPDTDEFGKLRFVKKPTRTYNPGSGGNRNNIAELPLPFDEAQRLVGVKKTSSTDDNLEVNKLIEPLEMVYRDWKNGKYVDISLFDLFVDQENFTNSVEDRIAIARFKIAYYATAKKIRDMVKNYENNSTFAQTGLEFDEQIWITAQYLLKVQKEIRYDKAKGALFDVVQKNEGNSEALAKYYLSLLVDNPFFLDNFRLVYYADKMVIAVQVDEELDSSSLQSKRRWYILHENRLVKITPEILQGAVITDVDSLFVHNNDFQFHVSESKQQAGGVTSKPDNFDPDYSFRDFLSYPTRRIADSGLEPRSERVVTVKAGSKDPKQEGGISLRIIGKQEFEEIAKKSAAQAEKKDRLDEEYDNVLLTRRFNSLQLKYDRDLVKRITDNIPPFVFDNFDLYLVSNSDLELFKEFIARVEIRKVNIAVKFTPKTEELLNETTELLKINYIPYIVTEVKNSY